MTSGSLDPFNAHQDYASSSHLWLLVQNIVHRTRSAFNAHAENPTVKVDVKDMRLPLPEGEL